MRLLNPDEEPVPHGCGPSALRKPSAPDDDRGMADSLGTCTGTIVVHRDGTLTCTEPGCDASVEPRTLRHVWFIPCAESLGPECPRCSPIRTSASASGGEGCGHDPA